MRRQSLLAALVGVVSVLGLVAAGMHADSASAAINVQVPCAVDGPNGLIAAIRSANRNGGGRLQLTSGCTYTLTKRDNDGDGGSGLPVLRTPIMIDGTGATIARSAAANTSLFRILHVGKAGTISITGLRMTGGDVFDSTSANQGGAILNEGNITTLSNVTITGNAAAIGGGVGNEGTIATLSNSTISGNTAANGGGVFNMAPGKIMTFDNVMVKGNVAGIGGGISNGGLIDALSSSTISDNRLDASVGVPNGAGGGIANSFGTIHLYRDIVARNTATSGPLAAGGGIESSGLLTLDSTLVGDNVASGVGGGIKNEAQVEDPFVLTVRSSLILRNTVSSPVAGPAVGGGIYNQGDLVMNSSAVQENMASAPTGRAVGAGIYNDGSLRFNQSTAAANTVSDHGGEAEGGGIYVDEDSIRTVLNNSSVVHNAATGALPHGGGIYFQAPGAAVRLGDSVVSNNQPENCFPIGSVAGCKN